MKQDFIRQNRGFHPVVEEEQTRLFIDGCVQIWQDAELENAHRHGADVYAVTAFLPWVNAETAMDELMKWHLLPRQYSNLRIVETAQDIVEAKAAGQASLMLSAQDGEFIGGSLGRVEAFQRLGLRMLILAYNRDNLLSGGCADSSNTGLSLMGRRVVEECNRVGILLDGSHMSSRASLEMIEHSSAPVVFSHSNPKGVVDNPRNISDEQIRACASKDGVIGVVPWGPMVYKPETQRRPNLADLLDCVDYIADLLGSTENIGLGTDFSLGTYEEMELDPWGTPNYFSDVTAELDKIIPNDMLLAERFTEGFDSYPEISNVISGLHNRGYDDKAIDGILGQNFLRVFKQVW